VLVEDTFVVKLKYRTPLEKTLMMRHMSSKVGMRPLWADLEDLSDEATTADQQGSEGNEESKRSETSEGLNSQIGKPSLRGPSWADMDDSEDERTWHDNCSQTSIYSQSVNGSLDDDMLLQVPKDADGFATSLGTIKHISGTCAPCCFHYRKRCTNGILCSFCHAEHEQKKPFRPSKVKRERLLRYIRSVAEKVECDSSLDTLDAKVTKCLDLVVRRYDYIDMKDKVVSYLFQGQTQKNGTRFINQVEELGASGRCQKTAAALQGGMQPASM